MYSIVFLRFLWLLRVFSPRFPSVSSLSRVLSVGSSVTDVLFVLKWSLLLAFKFRFTNRLIFGNKTGNGRIWSKDESIERSKKYFALVNKVSVGLTWWTLKNLCRIRNLCGRKRKLERRVRWTSWDGGT